MFFPVLMTTRVKIGSDTGRRKALIFCFVGGALIYEPIRGQTALLMQQDYGTTLHNMLSNTPSLLMNLQKKHLERSMLDRVSSPSQGLFKQCSGRAFPIEELIKKNTCSFKALTQ